MTDQSLSIEKDFVILSPDKKASIEQINPMFYERLGKKYGDFKGYEIICCYEFNENWSSWEIHPNGDEIVILLSGKITFVLQLETGEKSISLVEEGNYIIVPKNTWHTAKTNVKAKMLFITPGEGTQVKNI